MDGSTPRRKSVAHLHSPPVFIYALSTNFVLEISGGNGEDRPLIMEHPKKSDNAHQLWIIEDTDSNQAQNPLKPKSEREGSNAIAARRKDDAHIWRQQWEFHRGFIRSMANHNLVLDVEFRNVLPGASVHVLKPNKHGNHEHQIWGLKLENGSSYNPPAVILPLTSKFDSSKLEPRLAKLWNLQAKFGAQTTPEEAFFHEIVSDRYCLINGMQLLRDELQLAFEKGGDLMACAADLTQPTVTTTLAYTNCGDRINHPFHALYDAVVASRFASIAARGELMTENFSPAGGGTDDGGVLAHVTVGHQLDDTIRRKIYEGNKSSYVLVNIDLMTHVGFNEYNGKLVFGDGRESEFRETRRACGAIIATLTSYDNKNVVHHRLKRNLGDKNFEVLQKKIKLADGTDITYVVAAAIIAVQGLRDTCFAMTSELDQRGVAHITASTTINGPTDGIFYLARATVFGGKIRIQGFGLDASKYSGTVENSFGKKRVLLTYDGKSGDRLDMEESDYTVKQLQQ